MRPQIDTYEGFTDPIASTTSTGAGGNTAYPIRPPLGDLWDISNVIAFHDDGVARAIGFSWYNATSTTSIDFSLGTAVAASVFVYMFKDGYFNNGRPCVASYYSYPIVMMYAATAAKNLYVRALVRKMRGSMNIAGA